MYELIAQYGIVALGLLLGGLTSLLAKYLLVLIEVKIVREYALNLWDETVSAVREVGTGYVEAIKEGRADGKLTSKEKTIAKRRAIDIAKSNFGKKGLKRLAKVFDVDDWIGNKVEAVVAKENSLGKSSAQKPE